MRQPWSCRTVAAREELHYVARGKELLLLGVRDEPRQRVGFGKLREFEEGLVYVGPVLRGQCL
jgi:hypothetical protein